MSKNTDGSGPVIISPDPDQRKIPGSSRSESETPFYFMVNSWLSRDPCLLKKITFCYCPLPQVPSHENPPTVEGYCILPLTLPLQRQISQVSSVQPLFVPTFCKIYHEPQRRPHSFLADPDQAGFLNAYPHPDANPGSALQNCNLT